MKDQLFWRRSRNLYRFLIIICALAVIVSIAAVYFYQGMEVEITDKDSDYTSISKDSEDPDKIENGIHVRTGFVEGEGLMTVVNNCTNCHSAQLVIQNRMDKERWVSTIRWMQKTQNLWDLGANEEVIVNYLVTNYPPLKKGRRVVLSDIQWYDLKY